MKWHCATLSLVVFILLTEPARAEGLIYQLANDGAWAKFKMDFEGVDRDGTEKQIRSGTLTISSVGIVEMDGQRCRWIEFAFESKRLNAEVIIDVDKLLIPEKHLSKGEDPLKHVLKGWYRHPKNHGGLPIEIPDVQNADGPGRLYLDNHTLRQFVRGPFEAQQKLDKAVVESKLGKLECEGSSAQERTTIEDVMRDSKYVIRFHKDAPFGVVSWEVVMKFEQAGKHVGTSTMKATLSDFGQNAKSSIPEAK